MAARLPWVNLGDWPTPLDSIELAGRRIWIKREGDSSPRYGGNKIRTLEAWLGHAREAGAKRIWAIGAYGSNHAIATVLHARAVGLDAGAVLFPQPRGATAFENAGALVASGCELVRLRHVVEVPFAAIALARRDRATIVMPPGGATPIGTFGALAAALELAEQIAAGLAPVPQRIVVPIGSTCTAAGLLAGLVLAEAIGAWPGAPATARTRIHAVRVTPWPVTSRLRTAALAWRTLARIAELGGPRVAVRLRDLVARLVVDGRELGAGYGRRTPASIAASAELGAIPGSPRLDAVYSAKAAAALVRLHRGGVGPLLFWSTKSSIELAPPSVAALALAPAALRRWLAGAG